MRDNVELLKGPPTDTCIAIWTAIFVKYFSCFGGSESRRTLDAKKVFKGNELAKDAFYRLQDIRNKSVVHDENSSVQSNAVLEIINRKPERTLRAFIFGGTINSIDQNNFRVLIEQTASYLTSELERFGKLVQNEINEMSTEEINALEELKRDGVASMFDVHKKRVRTD